MSEKPVAANPLRKITTKTVYGKINFEDLLKDKSKAVPIMQVWGVVTRTMTKESDYGPYVRFIGQFRAVNMKTGERFRAPVVLLPKFMEEDLAGAMNGDGKNAEFAVTISAKYDESAATKYVYLADSLIEVQESDVLAGLEQKIQQRAALPDKTKGKK